MIKIAPSILAADFAALGQEIKRIENADYLHIDVMDGHFVPNLTIGPPVVAALRPHSRLVFDVHLMIAGPERYIASFLEAGADLITIHAETGGHLHRTLTQIKEGGARAGLALNPATPPEVLQYLVELIDLVLVMTVNPGFGGQAFIPGMLAKIAAVKQLLEAAGSSAEIAVDGGIDAKTAPLAAKAGATVLVAGSAIFGSADPAQAVDEIRRFCGGR
ncbi:MAG: ribulose-phosphate 3-epimerase [Bacillota bacterium]